MANPQVELHITGHGVITLELDAEKAPKSTANFLAYAREGAYDNVVFHRVIDGFMAQTGDPTGTGEGGSTLPDLKAEFNQMPHLRGTLSMARTNEPDSANSQFFIVFYPRFALDHRYTNFGRVISGMDVVDEIVRGEPPVSPTKILQASMLTDNLPRPAAPVVVPANITADMLSNSRSN